MKTKLNYIIMLLFAMVFYTSCSKEKLDLPPLTSISEASSFDTPARIKAQVLSLYSTLKSGTFYGGRYQVYGDIRGEDFKIETTNLVTGVDVYNHNLANSATSVKGLWSQAYLTINRCNVFIDGMAAKGATVVGAAQADQYVAEAKLIRALSYYSLLQYFARPYADGNGSKPGLPLRLTGILGSGSSDLARSTVAQVYEQVIADLDFAESKLPLTNGSAILNTTRAHRNTAIALKTRVYLSMQKYDKVISEANKIVPNVGPFTASSGVAHALQADITNVFKSPYTTTESIFSLPMASTSGDNPGTQNAIGFYFYNNGAEGTPEYSLNPSGILANAGWKLTDKRRSLTKTFGTMTLVSKFNAPSPWVDYAPVIRWSEVLLNLSEAIVRNGNSVDSRAVALLNAVRQRSDATTTLNPATVADFNDAISIERRIEFLGEGLRNNDITRLLLTFPAKSSAPSKAPNEAGYIWPISSDELSLNKLMTDN